MSKLKGRENYYDWCFAAQNVLVLEGMAACIQEELSATPSAAELANDAKAKAKLVLTIDPSLYVHIKQAVTAYEIWNTLRTMFDDSGYTRKISLAHQYKAGKLRVDDTVCDSDRRNESAATRHRIQNN